MVAEAAQVVARPGDPWTRRHQSPQEAFTAVTHVSWRRMGVPWLPCCCDLTYTHSFNCRENVDYSFIRSMSMYTALSDPMARSGDTYGWWSIDVISKSCLTNWFQKTLSRWTVKLNSTVWEHANLSSHFTIHLSKWKFEEKKNPTTRIYPRSYVRGSQMFTP